MPYNLRVDKPTRSRRTRRRATQRCAQETARPARSRSDANSLRRRLELGRRRRETRTGAPVLLAARHLALLHSAGRRRDLSDNRMPLEGGIYQWAKLGFNEFAGFIVAWNLWLLSITVIALGGMFVTTNISYAIGPGAAWMPNSKWCVSLISAALVVGLGWAGVRGLSFGKWVHNIGAFAMLMVYAALILLPFFALARGELKSYHPLQFALPAMSIFYCFNIFTKLAVGALSGFEYVAILAGETRAPARDIGRSVLIASPVIALMFILGTSSVLAFIGDNPIDLIGPVPQTLRLGLRSFPIAGAIASIGILLMTDAHDFFDQRSRNRQLAIANGRRLGPFAAELVLAFASAIQDANQLDHIRRRGHAGDCDRQPDRCWNSGSISTGR